MTAQLDRTEGGTDQPARSYSLPLGVVVFVTGSVSLGAEIAATRLLEPWFGASTIVWANTIAVVLVALSVGYSIGGRLADRDPSMAGLSRIILVASVLIAAVPFVANPFLRASVDAFDSLSVGTFAGSLLGVMVLIAVPLLLVGAVSPYAVRLAVDRVEDSGRVAGRLYAISTFGSLVGTFAAALVLIPFVGTRRTFLVFALLLALAAIAGLRRHRLPALIVPALILVLIALPTGILKSGTAGSTVIWEKETRYQYGRVLQAADGERTLELNEGQAVHSLYRPGSYLTTGYWDQQLALMWAGRSDLRSVAILGSAAGTTARALGHYSPTTHIDAVEIDKAVTQAGRKYFDLQAPDLQTYADDARPWLERTTTKQDAIVIDAYRQPYIPFYLTTKEFFALVRDRLAPGGVVVVNVGQPAGSTKLEKVLAATMRTAFGDDRVYRDPAQRTNTLLVGTTDDTEPADALRAKAPTLPAEVEQVLDGSASRIEPALTGGDVYTDDKAPVEWLVDLSLAKVAETGEGR
ncbi:spermidine synthase [Marmoricola endophyticus]|uniref:Spermidine synthase n=1 Tax=Marmoricola endophyticus TaxID=2040280 RepID=A0A917BUS0_9ACTN|nr:fused MFS/spermidine synthase [Marmoricola endophyticus]GGF55179.1 spermidine synthase [Marmoricola endophyticus]